MGKLWIGGVSDVSFFNKAKPHAIGRDFPVAGAGGNCDLSM